MFRSICLAIALATPTVSVGSSLPVIDFDGIEPKVQNPDWIKLDVGTSLAKVNPKAAKEFNNYRLEYKPISFAFQNRRGEMVSMGEGKTIKLPVELFAQLKNLPVREMDQYVSNLLEERKSFYREFNKTGKLKLYALTAERVSVSPNFLCFFYTNKEQLGSRVTNAAEVACINADRKFSFVYGTADALTYANKVELTDLARRFLERIY